jgi:ribonuclease VapC
MVIDSSAILAIALRQREAEAFADVIDRTEDLHMSAASYLEAAIVVDRRRDTTASLDFDEFLRTAAIAIEPVTAESVKIARQAYRQFGKGRHPAGLNFGDCFSYALAKAVDQPLLFKGDNFPQTDVASAIS